MNIPFTADQFFHVFARYNEAVWPAQIFLNLLALAAIVIIFQTRPWTDRAISIILSLLWTWMAVAYHFAFFASINPAAWGFGILFILGAIAFAYWGAFKGMLRFRFQRSPSVYAGAVLMVYALLLYPLIGFATGHRFPAAPTFGLPCPTTIFTIGVLLSMITPAPRSVFAVPLLWSAIGSIAAFKLDVLQDLGLLVAGIVGLASLFFFNKAVKARLDEDAAPGHRRPGGRA